MAGEAQELNNCSSSAHSKVEFGSLLENVKVAVVSTVMPSGPELIVVSGATTVQVWLAGVGSRLPSALMARTRSSCVPRASSVNSAGEEQEVNNCASREHSKVPSASLVKKAKVAVVSTVVAAGPEMIEDRKSTRLNSSHSQIS